MILLIPFVDKATSVDLREFYLEIPRQDSITKDNAPIAVDFVMFYKVLDAQMSVVQVGNFAGAALNIASTTLRAVIGDIPLDDMLAKRDEINTLLRIKLDEVTERWGVKVTNVEIREIIPPAIVQEAMTRQMSAERTRRAVVTEAEGAKSASITVAEGNKEAAILNAEGSKQSAILTAEGERQAAILRAEGFALALRTINESASTADAKTMQLQYLDALRALGVSPSSKVVVPMELSRPGRGHRLAGGGRGQRRRGSAGDLDRDRHPGLLHRQLEVVTVGHGLERVLDRDLALLHQVEQRLVERDHAVELPVLDDVLDLVRLVGVGDTLGDAAGVDQDLQAGGPATVHGGDQPLAHDAPQRAGQGQANLLLLVRGEEVDHAVHRLGGVHRVQRGQDQVPGLGGLDRGANRLGVAHLPDQDHVGVLAERGAQRRQEVLGVVADLTLVDRRDLVACRTSIGSSIVTMWTGLVLLM